MKLKLGVIGGGRMGHAIVSSLIGAGVYRPGQILVADPDRAAQARARKLKCRVSGSAADAARAASVVLAVKPQMAATALAGIAPLTRGKPVISIMAGVTRRRLKELLPGSRPVRAMPNTPLMARAGAVVVASDGLAPRDRALAKKLFVASGLVWFRPERELNAVTALSGSGPALYCAFLESYAAAGRRAGLGADLALALAVQTLIGTARLLETQGLTPRVLREGVTSPGGTTAAALEILRGRGLDGLMRAAFNAAVRRGRELGQGKAVGSGQRAVGENQKTKGKRRTTNDERRKARSG